MNIVLKLKKSINLIINILIGFSIVGCIFSGLLDSWVNFAPKTMGNWFGVIIISSLIILIAVDVAYVYCNHIKKERIGFPFKNIKS